MENRFILSLIAGILHVCMCNGQNEFHPLVGNSKSVEHRAKRASTEYIVEVVVWIAPDLFQFQKTRLGATNSETSAWFETYREALIRDIDLTFQKVSTINLRIQYVGGGVTQSESTSWFADNYKDPFLADQDTLSDVKTFLQNKIGGAIPSYDHAIVLTRADLAKNTNGDKSERQAAATGIICDDNSGSSVSIAEVSGPFYRKLVAQAIGLGFGLKYEFGADVYRVMARDNPPFPVPDISKDEIFSFGSSRDTILAETIGDFRTQCLTSNDSGQDFNTFINGDKIGTTYTNDEQCAILYGAGSTVCSGNTDPSKTCYSDVKCKVSSACTSNIILGQESECNAAKSLGCSYSACTYNRGGSSSSSSSSSSSTSSTAATTTSTKAATSTTTSSTTSSTTSISTSTTVSTSTQSSSMLPSSSPSPDCCCERRPLGEVKINIEYIPCPNGNPDNKFIVD